MIHTVKNTMVLPIVNVLLCYQKQIKNSLNLILVWIISLQNNKVTSSSRSAGAPVYHFFFSSNSVTGITPAAVRWVTSHCVMRFKPNKDQGLKAWRVEAFRYLLSHLHGDKEGAVAGGQKASSLYTSHCWLIRSCWGYSLSYFSRSFTLALLFCQQSN